MLFRPFPILTLIAIPALAALVGLGVWQMQRAEWKAELIADYERVAAAPPMSLEEALCPLAGSPLQVPSREQLSHPIDSAEVVAGPLMGWPPAGAQFRMYGQDANGAAGWRRLVLSQPPGCLAAEGPILIEGPFELLVPGKPEALTDPGSPPSRYIAREWPVKSAFTVKNSPETNDWHWFDVVAMERYLDIPQINSRFYLGIMPDALPAHLARTPPETHYGYAITWFGIAVAFVVIYALFHARAGRLRFGKRA
jgi:surfeit locus 1 family protein